MFDWNDLRHFLAVARTGSSAGAARLLGVSQPTVVRRIAALEQQLRLTLFDRHSNGYRLTAHGETLLAEARRVEDAAAAFDLVARTCARSDDPSIRLTVPEALVAGLTPLIVEFRKRHPSIRVEMRSDDAWLDIAKGEADVAVRAGQWTPADDLVGTEFNDLGWALYASPAYVDERGMPRDLDDLADHAIIGAEGQLADARAFQWLEERSGHSAVVWRGNVLSAVISAVKAGLGIAPLPCAVAARVDGIEPVSRAITELTGSLWVLTRPDLRLHPPVKHLMELIAGRIRQQRAVISGDDIVLRGGGPTNVGSA